MQNSISKHYQYGIFSLFFFILLLFSGNSFAWQNGLTQQADVKAWVKKVSDEYSLSPAYINTVLSQAHFVPELITKMGNPAEAKTWGFYHDFFITPDRIADGVAFYNQYQPVLAQEEKTYGVPANVVVAILGVETKYGQKMGKYRVLDTLATLAFKYPPRAQFFQNELADFLLMCKKYHLDPLTVYGSRSGAVGLCQFMPSSVLRYGVKFNDSQNLPDLFNNSKDAIFSIGNFLMQNGWTRDKQISSPALVSGNNFYKIAKQNSRAVTKPVLTLADLETFGVKPAGDFDSKDKAYLMMLDNHNGREYWLGLHNFYVITRYNNSDLYAMVVYQFAQELEAAKQEQQKAKSALPAPALAKDNSIKNN